MSEQGQRVQVSGSAYAELHLEGRWALSLLTQGWSDCERQALLDGDATAKAELKDALIGRILGNPDEFDVETFELTITSEAPNE